MAHPDNIVGLQRVASDAAADWSPTKVSMALRALGLEGDAESLDAIAAEFGVSRETVRRARIELIHRVEVRGTKEPAAAAILAAAPSSLGETDDWQTKARALRRLLTMTGPLSLDETLSAWARASGKSPYGPLPTNYASFKAWSTKVGGLLIQEGSPIVVEVSAPESLDQVGHFLFRSLHGKPNGVDRLDLLRAAGVAGLKPTTVATALSTHPAVVRVARGRWGLRGHTSAVSPEQAVKLRAPQHQRPTSFSWSPEGALKIEFSVPQGPSPVVAIPKAIVTIVEGREFMSEQFDIIGRITIKNARMWGFGSTLNLAELQPGDRASITLNLIAGTATVSRSKRREATK